MKNKIPHFLAFLSFITFSYCTSSKKVSTTASSEPAPSEPALTPAFTYEKDIAPFMIVSCSPCHFPETGKVKQLDTYEATSKNIDLILTRVQLPVDHEGYMPLMSKKPALTEREIAIMKLPAAEQRGICLYHLPKTFLTAFLYVKSYTLSLFLAH